VAERVAAARAQQAERRCLNRDLGRSDLDDLAIDPAAAEMLGRAVDASGLTARGFDRIRRVARTLADLAEAAAIEEHNIAEALALRGSW
jgi:magnesium chelatase family protein